MPVNVSELTTDVSVEQDGGGGEQSAEQRPWDRLAQWRTLRERAAADAARTRAEGFDD